MVAQRWPDVSPYKGENMRASVTDPLGRAPGVATNIIVRDEVVLLVDATAASLVGVRWLSPRRFLATLAKHRSATPPRALEV